MEQDPEQVHTDAALWAADRALKMLEECIAERDRLQVIVDLCVLEYETRAPSPRWGSKERADVFRAHNAAMAAEACPALNTAPKGPVLT